MTTQKQSGEKDELKPGDGVRIDEKTKFEYGADLETEGVPLIDPGVGKTVSLRVFEFKMNPRQKDFSDKQAIFNSHVKQISTILWSDGLVPYEIVSPRVLIDKSRKTYKIIVPCQAKMLVNFTDKPKNLSEYIGINRKPD